MKYTKYIFATLAWAFVLYVSFFFLWVMMIFACIENKGEEACGSDLMTRTAQVLYGPIISAL